MKVSSCDRTFLILLKIYIIQCVASHARLTEPPSRSSMWRFGYHTPKNYDDDGLYCGGMEVQYKKNGGKCGVCGDPWHLKPPRPNETGGKYGQGIIVRSYKTGQVIRTAVEVTANHRGYFEFRVCPSRNDKKEVTQECLNTHILKVVNSSSTKYFVEQHGSSTVKLAVQLPKSLTCKHCVLQWTYIAGNNWGKCKDDSHSLGCGSQETFKACSDISIGNNYKASTVSPTFASSTTSYQLPVTKPPKADKKKFSVSRPHPTRAMSFKEALKKIKNDPRLRWMLQPKKPNS